MSACYDVIPSMDGGTFYIQNTETKIFFRMQDKGPNWSTQNFLRAFMMMEIMNESTDEQYERCRYLQQKAIVRLLCHASVVNGEISADQFEDIMVSLRGTADLLLKVQELDSTLVAFASKHEVDRKPPRGKEAPARVITTILAMVAENNFGSADPFADAEQYLLALEAAGYGVVHRRDL